MRKEETKAGGSTVTVLHFDSAAELADLYAKQHPERASYKERSEWTGGTIADSLRKARSGDTALVPAAESLLADIDAAGIELDWPTWTDDVAGARPNVPAFLSGVPLTMRRKVETNSDRAPLRLFVDLTSSGGIAATALLKRGTSALALAMTLSTQRPVTLFAVVGLGDSSDSFAGWLTIPIPAAPLEIATACAVLTDVGITRTLGYQTLTENTRASGSWPRDCQPFGADREKFIAHARADLGMTPQDVYLPPVYVDDTADIANPVRWVNNQLAAFRERADG